MGFKRALRSSVMRRFLRRPSVFVLSTFIKCPNSLKRLSWKHCAVSGLLVSVNFLGCVQRQGLGPGENAPSFSLPSTVGTTVSLSSFAGRVVLVNFWASWCQPCLQELPALERLRLQLGSQDFEVVSVGVDDDMQSLREAAQRVGVTFPVLLDVTGEVKRNYKVQGVPETFVLDQSGRFQMITDAASGPVVKFVGPRDWDDERFVRQIKKLIQQ